MPHPLSYSFSSDGSSVPAVNVVSGVVTSALVRGGGGVDGTSSRDVFSLVPVPEIDWLVESLRFSGY